MKLTETTRTVTTIDLSYDLPGDKIGGNIKGAIATVATIERGTFCAGYPSQETLADHKAALSQLANQTGWKLPELPPALTTHGYVTRIYF